jgi:glutamate/tyrosine decarboxylase-like PLP-dependent enzyme
MNDGTAALLKRAAHHAEDYLRGVSERPVGASATSAELRQALGGPLGHQGTDPQIVLDALAAASSRGTVASAGPRFFGFVVGGSLPMAVAADWLVSAWDQNAGLYVLSPLVSVVEDIVAGWLRDLVGLSSSASVGFVTGCQMANFTGLAAARHHVLARAGWDVEANGLSGAPPIDLIVSDEAHYTIFMALRLLGLGAARPRRVPTDAQGRMRVSELRTMLAGSTGPCIVCAQAGNVNTGAFDPIDEIAAASRARDAWLHVDGAFGLWALASASMRDLVSGVHLADSVATDAHKWLNVPYDSGIVFCAHRDAHRAAMSLAAAYILSDAVERDPHEFVPEESRRARAVPVYAALRTLGRDGLRDVVERCCRLARRMADRLSGHPSVRILNDIVLNQVLVRVGAGGEDAEALTKAVIAGVQQDGTCWLGGTTWHGMAAMRVSVSNWSTTDDDIDRSAAAILRVVDRTNLVVPPAASLSPP